MGLNHLSSLFIRHNEFSLENICRSDLEEQKLASKQGDLWFQSIYSSITTSKQGNAKFLDLKARILYNVQVLFDRDRDQRDTLSLIASYGWANFASCDHQTFPFYSSILKR